MTDFIVPEYRSLVAQAMYRRMDGKTIEPYKIEILTKSGVRRTLAVRGSLIKFTRSRASLNILTDITERKAAEKAIRTFSRDLERKVVERTSDLSDINTKLVTEMGIRLDAEKQLTKTVGEKDISGQLLK
jgi:C4-dicarboxylate-specific signal transduction histidine kinase